MKTRTRQQPGFTLSLVGKGGTGKTQLSLDPVYGPPYPLSLISADPNTTAIVRKFNLREVEGFTHHKILLPALAFDDREDVKAEAEEKWEELRDVLRPIVKGEEKVRTVVLDTATEQYQMGVLATFGKGDQISPENRRNMMGPVNSRWKGIVAALEQQGCNVILIHRGKPAWGNVVEELAGGKERETRQMLTGPFDIEREGYSGTEFMVSTEVYLAFDPNRKDATRDESKFGMKVVRCQQRPGLIGKEFWGREKVGAVRVPRASWRWLCTQLYKGTQLSDWE